MTAPDQPARTGFAAGSIPIALQFVLLFGIPVAMAFVPVPPQLQKWLAVLVLLGLTLFLYRRKQKGLSELGLSPPLFGRYFPVGLFWGIAIFCALLLAQAGFNSITITRSANVNFGLVFTGLLYALPGVLMEELIFRGYCFQRTVDRIGFAKANWIFAFLFIVWHWVAFQAWGNWPVMLSLITTGFGHLFFAVGLRKTGTLWFPIAAHLGNNWASRNIFGYSMTGDAVTGSDSIFVLSGGNAATGTTHVMLSYLITLGIFLLFTWLVMICYRRRQMHQHRM